MAAEEFQIIFAAVLSPFWYSSLFETCMGLLQQSQRPETIARYDSSETVASIQKDQNSNLGFEQYKLED